MEPILLKDVASYYTNAIQRHGATARGVDWNDEGVQRLRFEQLLRIAEGSEEFSLNDLGCGYGALLDYLGESQRKVIYSGFDIADAMLEAAIERHGHSRSHRFIKSALPTITADYGVASGIFNVRLGSSHEVWEQYLFETLDSLHVTSKRGFAFNCLTAYSDPDRKREDLYYGDPLALFDRCKHRYAQDVALLHDYGLYEFTILVRKG